MASGMPILPMSWSGTQRIELLDERAVGEDAPVGMSREFECEDADVFLHASEMALGLAVVRLGHLGHRKEDCS